MSGYNAMAGNHCHSHWRVSPMAIRPHQTGCLNTVEKFVCMQTSSSGDTIAVSPGEHVLVTTLSLLNSTTS